MRSDANPYASPHTNANYAAPDGRARFAGRATVAILLGAAISLTAISLMVLWFFSAIDLGRFGIVFLASMFMATGILVLVAKDYFAGRRYRAVGLSMLVPCLILAAIMLALYDAGLLLPF